MEKIHFDQKAYDHTLAQIRKDILPKVQEISNKIQSLQIRPVSDELVKNVVFENSQKVIDLFTERMAPVIESSVEQLKEAIQNGINETIKEFRSFVAARIYWKDSRKFTFFSINESGNAYLSNDDIEQLKELHTYYGTEQEKQIYQVATETVQKLNQLNHELSKPLILSDIFIQENGLFDVNWPEILKIE